MNRSKIEWCDYTWNPWTGCSRRCEYCYAWAMSKRLRGRFGYPEDDPFKGTYHPERLHEPSALKKESRIFVCSMGELYEPSSPFGVVEDIYAEMRQCPQHIFISLTQRALMLKYYDNYFPDNLWQGVTVTTREQDERIGILSETKAKLKFVSFEPLLEPITPWLQGIDWVIIGAKTGSRKFQPPKHWVEALIAYARHFDCAVFLKNNLNWHESIKEFPS